MNRSESSVCYLIHTYIYTFIIFISLLDNHQLKIVTNVQIIMTSLQKGTQTPVSEAVPHKTLDGRHLLNVFAEQPILDAWKDAGCQRHCQISEKGPQIWYSALMHDNHYSVNSRVIRTQTNICLSMHNPLVAIIHYKIKGIKHNVHQLVKHTQTKLQLRHCERALSTFFFYNIYIYIYIYAI